MAALTADLAGGRHDGIERQQLCAGEHPGCHWCRECAEPAGGAGDFDCGE
jgi:hypothetical protein